MQHVKPAAPQFLLGLGNRKLGDFIHTFSLPAVDTCPGRSKLCEKVCYAMQGSLRIHRENGHYGLRLRMSRRRDFVRRMVREIQFRDCRLVRIHVAGDFYSATYAQKWVEIARQCPRVRFFCYTRSWRVSTILPELNELSMLRNCRVWFSCDRETGIPRVGSRRVRVAYMAVDDLDVPVAPSDLVFRVKRAGVAKRLGSTLVCPDENGVTATTCTRCGLCWSPKKDPRRFSLPMIH